MRAPTEILFPAGSLLTEPCWVIFRERRSGSWLNQAEIEISLFARQCLHRRRIPTLALLQQEAAAWNAKVNLDRVTIDWRFTRKKARIKFGYQRKRNRFIRSKT